MNFKIDPKPYTPTRLSGFGDDRIEVSEQMLIKGGKAWIPVMGEMHYSRVPRHKWEDTLRKMKEGGIEIVASYVFWIHHEEQKGEFDFRDNRDIRSFVQLCHKLGLEFCLRIGPWAHGECRNGGFPNWLVSECTDSLRTGREPYFSYVRQFIQKIADQIHDLPLFAIQIENEMTHNSEYIEAIRRLVLEAGLSAPLYTATGWGQAKLPKTVLPMYGGYPEAPWTQHTMPIDDNTNYFFSKVREDACIGADILGTAATGRETEETTPFMTCELGGGNQVTYHRRPLIGSRDIEALAICKLGSGANLLGYYMYAGGCNPIGNTTMQESRASGYPNDYPVVSYDFQSPIGDMGQVRESRMRLSYIHQFLHSFGEMLAPMQTFMPDVAPASTRDVQTLRCALRSDGNGGFLFVNNHVRLQKMKPHPAHTFHIEFLKEELSFSLNVPADCTFLLPVNLSVANLPIRYATAQPVSYTDRQLVLLEIPDLAPTLTLRDGSAFCLQIGVNRILDTDVVLLPYEEYVCTPLTEIPIERVECSCDADILFGHLSLADKSSEYAVSWTKKDRWMVIDAVGNIGGFYVNGQLISDFYLYGDKWVIDLSELPSNRAILKIQPLCDEDKDNLYMEIPCITGTHTPKVYVSQANELYI